ncbi:MAG TPA: YIP1 family protein [Gallionella sp.]|nr:YIP1 family protein [Gallionella sp.]
MAQITHMPLLGWDAFARNHISALKLFLFYALPLSVVPPAMIYYAGVEYGGHLLPALDSTRLDIICAVFFIAELIMTFIVAFVVQRMTEIADTRPAFEDAYKLSVVVATPLWLAPLFLFIPSFNLNITIGSLALVLSGVLLFSAVSPILKVKPESTVMLSSSLLAIGMVAWAIMMYLTLLTWSFVAYDVFA